MNRKRLIIAIVIIAIIIVAIVLMKFSSHSAKNGEDSQTAPTVSSKVTVEGMNQNASTKDLGTDYVKLLKYTASQASFKFSVDVAAKDIIPANIEQCVINVSAGDTDENSKPSCKETSRDNKFALSYDAKTQTLTITATDTSDWGKGNGPFDIGCAACESAVSFSGLHTADGAKLDDTMVLVY